MKHVIAISICMLLFSCSEQKVTTINLRVNHYRQTAVGVGPTLVYLVQKGDDIGTENWQYFYAGIEGFDYEPGYIYDLNVRKQRIKNPPADGSSIKYVLQQVISKTKVDDDIPFEITLKSVEKSNPPSFVTGDKDAGFKLLGLTNIDCGTLCGELSQALQSQDELSGVFNHEGAEIIKLKELKTESNAGL